MPSISTRYSRSRSSDPNALDRGEIAGLTSVVIRGHSSALDTSRTVIHPGLANGTLNQSSIHTTPATVKLSSSSIADDLTSTGAEIVQVAGLDAAGAAQTENVTLDGQTEVVTTSTWSAINSVVVTQTGSGNQNAGTIWVGAGTVTAGVPATKFLSVEIGHNKSQSAYYTVPASKTLYLRTLNVSVGTATKDVDVYIETSADGTLWLTELILPIEPVTISMPVSLPGGVAAGSHVRIEGLSSAASTDIFASLVCELKDD